MAACSGRMNAMSRGATRLSSKVSFRGTASTMSCPAARRRRRYWPSVAGSSAHRRGHGSLVHLVGQRHLALIQPGQLAQHFRAALSVRSPVSLLDLQLRIPPGCEHLRLQSARLRRLRWSLKPDDLSSDFAQGQQGLGAVQFCSIRSLAHLGRRLAGPSFGQLLLTLLEPDVWLIDTRADSSLILEQ